MFNRPIPALGTQATLGVTKAKRVVVFNRFLGRLETIYPRRTVFILARNVPTPRKANA